MDLPQLRTKGSNVAQSRPISPFCGKGQSRSTDVEHLATCHDMVALSECPH